MRGAAMFNSAAQQTAFTDKKREMAFGKRLSRRCAPTLSGPIDRRNVF